MDNNDYVSVEKKIVLLEKILGVKIESNDPIAIYNQIYSNLHDSYYENGFCSSLLIKKNAVASWMNKSF